MAQSAHIQPFSVGSDLEHPVSFGSGALSLICGPCVIESRDLFLAQAAQIVEVVRRVGLPLVIKASFDKANRTSIGSFRGVGRDEGLSILREARGEFSTPILTDVHSPEDCVAAAEVVDIVQIPAFLCRQTDLLRAAGNTGCAINVKKGQFLAPEDMAFAAEKIRTTGNPKILLCERGTTFGYRDLVVDFRSLVIMRQTGYPVIFDATHSVQRPGGEGGRTGGSREMIAPLARAGVAIGVDGVFLESHPDPDHAPSDGPNMIPVRELEFVLRDLKRISELQWESRA